MKDDFDIHRLDDVPDPLAGLGAWPARPREGVLAASPTRSRVAMIRATAPGGALLYELAWVMLMNRRDDLHTLASRTLFLELAIPIVAALLALAAAAAPDSRGMGQPKGRMALLAILAPVVFVAATVVGAPADVDSDPFLLHIGRCFVWTAIYSAGPLLLAAWAFRWSFVAAPAWRSAALGMACAAIGAATMSLVCGTGSPAHVLLGHGGMMLVAGAGGALLGRRFAA
jgi:hypothetical protein